MADAAPALGMAGTVIGLIGMFAAMDDPALMGPAMALAMLTTLYGLVLGAVLFGPIASRLERLSDIRDMLRMLADECPGEVPVSDCPILAFLTARRKDQQHNKKLQAAQDERSSLAKGVLS